MKLAIGILLLFITCSCTDNLFDQQKDIIVNYVDGYNQFDTGKMIQHMDENIIFQNVSNGQLNATTTGRKEFRMQAEESKLYFTERKQTIKSWAFSEEKVSVEIDYFGILKDELSADLQAGDTIRMAGISEFIFKDSKIIQLIDKT